MNPRHLLLLAAIFTFSAGAYADQLDSDGILRSDDGSIRYMEHINATQACPRGTHLATLRELAELSKASGAKGILKVSQVDPNVVPAGYYKVSVINHGGQREEFYFSREGYKRPSGHLGDNWFWSSSEDATKPMYAFSLDGNDGQVYSSLVPGGIHYFAVRCVVNHRPAVPPPLTGRKF